MAKRPRVPRGELFRRSQPPDGVVVINERCLIRTSDQHRVVVGAGLPLAQFAVGDRLAGTYAMVTLVEQGWADQNDVARAFGCSVRAVRRYQRRFETGGLAALGRPRGYPKGLSRVPASRAAALRRLKESGHSNRQIARRLGLSEKAVRNGLRRIGWIEPEPEQGQLALGDSSDPSLPAAAPPADPKLSASASSEKPPIPASLDRDPTDRRWDRLLARLGLLDDADPLFQPGPRVPKAGVLLAVPALVQSGAFECARDVYGSIGPAFYGLRTTILGLTLLALLRVKRPEALKEHSPSELGRVLGLDRAPEVKTLRRKLARLAAAGRAATFGRELAQRRVAARGAAMGFLYLDGHVRVYHGKHPIPKAHVARMRLCMPATTDYWVNDAFGDPLFVITAEANAGLARMLPPVLAEVRRLVGPRRVTVVFDRGGWSPKLFRKLLAEGFDVLTYRKGRFRPLPRSRFREYRARIEGRAVRYRLADQEVRFLGGRLRLRQVTRLSEDGSHQTPVVTSRWDLRPVEVAWRMFERWRQENFFKYLREEYALDALVQHAVEADDPSREVPNPAWHEIDTKYRATMLELQALSATYGLRAKINLEKHRRTMRGFKIAHAELGRQIEGTLRRLRDLQERRSSLPRRVPVAQRGPVVKLSAERKHLTNVLKMLAYQAESDLVRIVAPHYRRARDEGRTLVQSALASAADLELTPNELRVRLAPQSSPHRTRAVGKLCEDLNATPTLFPGTRLRLHFAVADPAP